MRWKVCLLLAGDARDVAAFDVAHFFDVSARSEAEAYLEAIFQALLRGINAAHINGRSAKPA